MHHAEVAVRELAVRDPINPRPRLILSRLLDTHGRHDEVRAELDQTGFAGADGPTHAAKFIRQLSDVRQRGYSDWGLLLWTKELAWLRREPALQEFLPSNGILAHWRKHGFPQQCRADGGGAYCQ
ncbi:hypothetical protein [Thermomonas sp.]